MCCINTYCVQQVQQVATVLLDAVARSQSGTDDHKAFVRLVTAACLAGLKREGSIYVLPAVQCTTVGAFIKGQKLSFPGKLVKYLSTKANSVFFHVVGEPPFQVLADLPALITTQHRNAEVQAILSHLTATGGSPSTNATTAPQPSQSRPARPSVGTDNHGSSKSSNIAAQQSSSSQASNKVRNHCKNM